MTVMQRPDLRASEKVFWFVRNAIERRLFTENLILANQTPYDEIYRRDIMSVRHYRPLEENEIRIGDRVVPVSRERHRVPLVLVPPLAATSIIFDLMPQRSLVRYLLARGFDLYLIDWGEVTSEHAGLSLETYVLDWMPDALAQIRRHSGQEQLSLFGYCMGGLLCLMHGAAAGTSDIRNMVTVASPVDMHRSGVPGRILALARRPAQLAARRFKWSILNLSPRFLHIPGWVNSRIFKMTNPVGSLISYWDLLINLWDREYVEEHTTVSAWFNDMVDYPGEMVKTMLVKVMLNNQMARGRMRMRDQLLDFSRIGCPLLVFAGDDDKLVSIPAARKALDIVSSQDKDFRVAPGGHAGVFAGSKAPDAMWVPAADWLTGRSD